MYHAQRNSHVTQSHSGCWADSCGCCCCHRSSLISLAPPTFLSLLHTQFLLAPAPHYSYIRVTGCVFYAHCTPIQHSETKSVLPKLVFFFHVYGAFFQILGRRHFSQNSVGVVYSFNARWSLQKQLDGDCRSWWLSLFVAWPSFLSSATLSHSFTCFGAWF